MQSQKDKLIAIFEEYDTPFDRIGNGEIKVGTAIIAFDAKERIEYAEDYDENMRQELEDAKDALREIYDIAGSF